MTERLTWINVDLPDEPRWGDRWTVQENAEGEPLYMVGSLDRAIPARWRVSRADGTFVAIGGTLAHAKEIAQCDYENGLKSAPEPADR